MDLKQFVPQPQADKPQQSPEPKEQEQQSPAPVKKSSGCAACRNTGLLNSETLCPECNGSPFGV